MLEFNLLVPCVSFLREGMCVRGLSGASTSASCVAEVLGDYVPQIALAHPHVEMCHDVGLRGARRSVFLHFAELRNNNLNRDAVLLEERDR